MWKGFSFSQPPVVLSIAGSDPSGGAGIQADIKAISALGCYAAAVPTAITVQNTMGVRKSVCLSAQLVREQVEAVLEDMNVAAIKIGMLGNAEIISELCGIFNKRPEIPVICDTILVSTSGYNLLADDAVELCRKSLFPNCRLITPNIPEADFLLGGDVSGLDTDTKAKMLAQRLRTSVLLKGGHSASNTTTDVLYDYENGSLHRFSSPRVESRNLHGTGCTLSSAIASFVAIGLPLSFAVEEAKKYITTCIVSAKNLNIGQGNGPLWHF
ncbi:MAG: bifunctional hydroxymethylpyrimidine kinase/phosphomethylpyrimidine kinase [Fibrobacter sp.]|nr:bifunctional hydroxymethylpyrimidine kinase/phosphomethylpyrimidine kinase [Bacteroidales bacterium]MCF0224539.1 bifunctional hydroxymethylpyrimidine kinase/phosphomethylpyrimidine kinase [Fibrobacter sp.]